MDLHLPPQNSRRSIQPRGLQESPPVCLLVTAPPCRHCRRAAPFKVCGSPSNGAEKNKCKIICPLVVFLFQTPQLCSICIRYPGWRKWRGGKEAANVCQAEVSAAVLPGLWGERSQCFYLEFPSNAGPVTVCCLTRSLLCFTPPAARTRGLPGGQSVGLWRSPAEGLACNHICPAARTLLRLSR